MLNAGSAVPKSLLKEGGPQDKPTGVIGYDTILPVPDWAIAAAQRQELVERQLPGAAGGRQAALRARRPPRAAECVLKLCTKALPELFKSA